jgi:hypothetical protein
VEKAAPPVRWGGALCPPSSTTSKTRGRPFQESALLEAWRDHVLACDVDAFVLFQVERVGQLGPFVALGSSATTRLTRCAPQQSAAAAHAAPRAPFQPCPRYGIVIARIIPSCIGLCPSQVRDTFGALVSRFHALQVDGGGLHLCRLARSSSRPLAIKSVVQCARSQGRVPQDCSRGDISRQRNVPMGGASSVECSRGFDAFWLGTTPCSAAGSLSAPSALPPPALFP